MTHLTTIAFDADDTLWHHERYFIAAKDKFAELLAPYADPADSAARLHDIEIGNVRHYGFGVKSFTLSMVETAIAVTGGAVPAPVIGELVEVGRQMLVHPVDPYPGVRETLTALKDGYKLLVVTRGDLFDQERKLAQSGLGDYFDGVEIVSDKTPATYNRVFDRYGDGPERAMMVGNSLKSDVAPAIEAGSWGVYVPHELTWVLEHIEAPEHHPRYRQIDHLGELRRLIESLA